MDGISLRTNMNKTVSRADADAEPGKTARAVLFIYACGCDKIAVSI